MLLLYCLCFGDVAQLARAPGSYPVGREFESPRRYQIWNKSLEFQEFLLCYKLFIFEVTRQAHNNKDYERLNPIEDYNCFGLFQTDKNF